MEEVGGGQVGPFEDLEVIRMEAGMSTARFVKLIDMPERTWRRWQAKARQDRGPKGPWPQPARRAARDLVVGHPLADACPIDPVTGEVLPVVTIVTDNGGPFRSIDFELFITSHPELHHVRTRVRSPGQNGSRERGFGTLKYERLFLDEIPDALTLVERAEDYRVEYNTQRPHEAIAWNRPLDVHLGRASAAIPTFEQEEILPTT